MHLSADFKTNGASLRMLREGGEKRAQREHLAATAGAGPGRKISLDCDARCTYNAASRLIRAMHSEPVATGGGQFLCCLIWASDKMPQEPRAMAAKLCGRGA